MSYVARLTPEVYSEVRNAFEDLKGSAPRKVDRKICGQIALKLENAEPKADSEVGFTQVFLTREEADYYNVIARALNLPKLASELVD